MDEMIYLARQFAKELQKTSLFERLCEARRANDEDAQLQELIGAFNLKRLSIEQAMADNKEEQRIADLNMEAQNLYKQIMENQSMYAYNEAKNESNALLSQIQTILSVSMNGTDPDEIELGGGCGGDCSGCAGCH